MGRRAARLPLSVVPMTEGVKPEPMPNVHWIGKEMTPEEAVVFMPIRDQREQGRGIDETERRDHASPA